MQVIMKSFYSSQFLLKGWYSVLPEREIQEIFTNLEESSKILLSVML